MNIQQLFANSFKNKDGTYSNTFTSKELEIIREYKLFKCFLPASLGGLELGLFPTLDIIEQCAYLNGSLGWMTQIGNGGNYFITNIEPLVAQHFFGSKDAVLTGSGTPTGIATPVDGGYEIDGISRCSSGSEYATVFTATCYIKGTTEIISALIPRNKVEIINDWDSIGMRLSSTNTTKFYKVFVPKDHIFKTSERISYLDLPILNLPFVIYAQAFFIHVVYGIVQRFLDEATNILNDRSEFWKAEKPERYNKLGGAIFIGASKIQSFKQESTDLFKMVESSELNNDIYHEQVRLRIVEHCQDLKKFVHTAFPILGMEVLDRKHIVNVCYSDLITICQHSLLN